MRSTCSSFFSFLSLAITKLLVLLCQEGFAVHAAKPMVRSRVHRISTEDPAVESVTARSLLESLVEEQEEMSENETESEEAERAAPPAAIAGGVLAARGRGRGGGGGHAPTLTKEQKEMLDLLTDPKYTVPEEVLDKDGVRATEAGGCVPTGGDDSPYSCRCNGGAGDPEVSCGVSCGCRAGFVELTNSMGFTKTWQCVCRALGGVVAKKKLHYLSDVKGTDVERTDKSWTNQPYKLAKTKSTKVTTEDGLKVKTEATYYTFQDQLF